MSIHRSPTAGPTGATVPTVILATPENAVVANAPTCAAVVECGLLVLEKWFDAVVNLVSFPSQNVAAPVPNDPVVNTPEAVVIIGKLVVEPIAPAFVMLP